MPVRYYHGNGVQSTIRSSSRGKIPLVISRILEPCTRLNFQDSLPRKEQHLRRSLKRLGKTLRWIP